MHSICNFDDAVRDKKTFTLFIQSSKLLWICPSSNYQRAIEHWLSNLNFNLIYWDYYVCCGMFIIAADAHEK